MGTEKIKGAFRKVGAAITGDAGILSTLEAEHTMVASLMDDVMSAGDDIDERRELYPKVRENLLVHARCEELEFYPACSDHEATRAIAADIEEDHDVVERLISELDRMAMDAPAWIETFQRLQRSVESHVETEETELFPRCSDIFDTSVLRDMDDDYRARKQEIEAELEPYIPQPRPSDRPPAI